jgi:methionine sulfoxide reductase heme-binding subunit
MKSASHATLALDPPAAPRPWPASARLLLATGCAGLIAMSALICLPQPGVDAVRELIRATARTSLSFFLLAFGAQALFVLWPGRWTALARRHRRQWGLLLVASHTMHALAILALARMAPDLFLSLSPPGSRIGPGIAYVLLWAMGATSFDRTAAWLGPKWWARLHTVGAYFLWLSFMVANGKRVAAQPAYLWPILALLAVMALRLWARHRGRRQNAA